MNTLIAIAALAVPLVLMAITHISRAYCRVQAVERERAGLWVAARPIGVLVGAAAWTIIRYVTPELTAPTGDASLVANLAASFVVSAVFLAIFDILVDWLFIDEPSFAESRELYLEHGSVDENGEDWVDVTFSDEEVKGR